MISSPLCTQRLSLSYDRRSTLQTELQSDPVTEMGTELANGDEMADPNTRFFAVSPLADRPKICNEKEMK